MRNKLNEKVEITFSEQDPSMSNEYGLCESREIGNQRGSLLAAIIESELEYEQSLKRRAEQAKKKGRVK